MRDTKENILFILYIVISLGIIFSAGKCQFDAHNKRMAEPKWTWKKICKDNDKRAKFIIDCAKAANPMSDEEGEDLVLQCERTSNALFCEYIKEYY